MYCCQYFTKCSYFSVLFWMGKDCAWNLLNGPMWIAFLIPTVIVACDFIYLTFLSDVSSFFFVMFLISYLATIIFIFNKWYLCISYRLKNQTIMFLWPAVHYFRSIIYSLYCIIFLFSFILLDAHYFQVTYSYIEWRRHFFLTK